jgi:D-tyrosyl-tRNA(Tyr) deacylase
MRAVLQRVSCAEVRVGGESVGKIGRGVLVLLGVGDKDKPEDARYVTEKIAELRIFPDAGGKMNLSLRDVSGEALVVSQFTLYADTRKGRRPSFARAGAPELAKPLVAMVAKGLRAMGVAVSEGVFGASMEVELVNEGPVTLLIDSP